MLSILVCHSYFLRFDQKQIERAKPYPPLATLQVASLLRRQGHIVSLFDAMLASGVEDFHARLRAFQPQVVLLYEDNFNFLSKMCLGKMRRAACEMMASARTAGARVIAAGADVTDAPEIYLRAGADIVLLGEGLPSLVEVMRRLDSMPSRHSSALIEGVPGVAALIDGAVSVAHGPTALTTAAETPSPAWDLVDMERYRAIWVKAHGYFSLNMAASRGCSFRCTWCAKPIWGNQYLQRSAAEVGAELIHLKRTFDPDHIWFADDIFGFRVDWVTAFAETLRKAGVSVPFSIQTRADLMSERMAQALRIAGCAEAWIGAESGSQRVLDAMNKGTQVAEIHAARNRLREAGIRVGFFIQLGYLDEELDDIVATRELLATARPDDVGVSVAYPLPGTRFYEIVKSQLRGKTHWQESNDLEMMFQGTYRSDFYRAVRDLLHEQVSLNGHGPSRELDRRWQALLSKADQYRTNPVHGLTS
jgi:anaerobic magnesium-protoporphyrin IX monomethyl ester cyclase